MAQCLESTALMEYQNSVPSAYIMFLTIACTYSSKRFSALFWHLWVLHRGAPPPHPTSTYIPMHIIEIENIKENLIVGQDRAEEIQQKH